MRGRTGFIWPVFELFDDKTAPHVDIIKRWLDPLVKQTLDRKALAQKTGIRSPMEEKTFLEHLADSTEGLCFSHFLTRILRLIHRQSIDAGMIRDQLLNVLLAARDTVCASSHFSAHFLMRRSFDRLRAF